MMNTDDTGAIEQLAERLKRLEQLIAGPLLSLHDVISGIAAIGKEPGAWELRLSAERHQAKVNRSLLKQIAAERAGQAEDTAKAIAEAEEQKKSAARMWARAAERERAVEAREQAVGERGEAKRSPPQYPDADPTFIPMAGSDFTRSLPRPLPVSSEPPPPKQARTTVKVGRADTTLAQSVETPE